MRAVCVSVFFCCAAGCTPPPVQAFERFYGATAARDVKEFRASLCLSSRAALSSVPDALLEKEMSVTKVVRGVKVVSHDDAGAVLDVEDATGGHETVAVQREEGAWCVALPEQKQ